MHPALGGFSLFKMEHKPNGDTNSQPTPTIREQSAEASEPISATQITAPSPDAAASNSILSLSETEGSCAGDDVPALSHSLPSTVVSQPFDLRKLRQHVDDLVSMHLKTEGHSESWNSTQSALPTVSQVRPAVPTFSLGAIQNDNFPHRSGGQRSFRATGMKQARVGSASGRALGESATKGQQLGSAERLRHAAASRSNSETKNAAHSASVFEKSRNSWAEKAAACRAVDASAHNGNAHQEGEASWQRSQLTPPCTEATSSQMVKSVSPAGVVRIGGRNRRKRTKYDLAYKQMEELGPFEEEVKSVDLSKVSGSSFALELLRNPQQYSYESWTCGVAWPVGADGRRLLLRKLRGVYWSNPEKWQRVLQENNLYRRDLFTLATVQELFEVTHLMGADVWDFLLKCSALTQKCDALSSKDVELGEDEAPEVSSPRSVPQRITQSPGAEACKSEDDLHASSDKFFGTGLPCSGFLRKRLACGGRDEKDMSKRSRGRPRKSHLKVHRLSSGLEDRATSPQTPRKMHTSAPLPDGGATPRWLSTMDTSNTKNEPLPSFRSVFGEALERRLLRMEDQRPTHQGSELPSTGFSERQRLAAALARSAAPVSSSDRFYRAAPPTKTSTSGAELRLLAGCRSNSSLLKLTAHYTFMAQFMQCCMLVEVQRTLLRLAEEFKPTWSPDRDMSGSSPKEGVKHTDPTAQACFESLMESSNIHMEFVQVIVQQLHRQADHNNAATAREGQHASATLKLSEELQAIMQQLQQHHQKNHSPFETDDAQRAECVTGDIFKDSQEISQLQLEQRKIPPTDGSAPEKQGNEDIGGLGNTSDREVVSGVPRVQRHKEVSVEGRSDGLTSPQASSLQ